MFALLAMLGVACDQAEPSPTQTATPAPVTTQEPTSSPTFTAAPTAIYTPTPTVETPAVPSSATAPPTPTLSPSPTPAPTPRPSPTAPAPSLTVYEELLSLIPDTTGTRASVFINNYALARELFEIPLPGPEADVDRL